MKPVLPWLSQQSIKSNKMSTENTIKNPFLKY